MCGRYTLHTPWQQLAEQFQVQQALEFGSRFNIVPTQAVPVVRLGSQGRELVMLKWGLLPCWAKAPKTEYSTINARAETVDTKPTFRSAFRQRRCLIPADGFYEWRPLAQGKQPYYIHVRSGNALAFAGLWEHWQGTDGHIIESCTIIVTVANDLIRPIHDRMPVILAEADWERWLDSANHDVVLLKTLLKPYPADAMHAYPVSKAVNNPRHDAADCITPAPDSTGLERPDALA